MADNLVIKTMSEVEREVKKQETVESYAWIRTADGSIQKVERKVAMFCPTFGRAMKSGIGFSKTNPISLPEEIKPSTLSLVIGYCKFHLVRRPCQVHKTFDENFFQMDARSLWELLILADYLQLGPLFDSTKEAMAQKFSNKSTEELWHMLKMSDDLSQLEKLKSAGCFYHDSRMGLLKTLYSRRRESSIKLVEDLKAFVTGVKPSQHEDTREVDDLVSFINGDGDTKVVKTSKKKKNHKKRKEQKRTTSSSAASSTKASTSKEVIEKNDEDINASDSAKPGGSSSDTVKLLGTEDETFSVNEDAFYVYLDPVLEEEDNRLIERFARTLNLDPAQIV